MICDLRCRPKRKYNRSASAPLGEQVVHAVDIPYRLQVLRDSCRLMAAAPRVAFAGQSIPAYARTIGRAVHVKIYPQPRNLAESTEVLRVLQQYGEVVMYKQLKVRSLLYGAGLIHPMLRKTQLNG